MVREVTVTVDAKYRRDGFDDWLAGGTVAHRGSTYYWSAQDSGHGFGWEVEPVSAEDWSSLSERESDELIEAIRDCLCRHETACRIELEALRSTR